MVIGDWGCGKTINRQKKIAAAMEYWATKNYAQFILSTGDNFSPNGVTSSQDEKFATLWSDIYNLPYIENLTWYLSLGNRDYGDTKQDGREMNQINFSASHRRWKLPSKRYSFHKQTHSFNVHFIIMDTESLHKSPEERTAQLKYLEDQLKQSEAVWKFVIGHHDPFSVGDLHPMDSIVQKHVVPLLEAYGAHILFSGHDHSLQHFKKQDVDYIVSGSGSQGPSSYNTRSYNRLQTLHVQLKRRFVENGFVGVIVNQNKTTLQFVNHYSAILHNYTRLH